jgi:hypothetical protein
MNTSIYTASHNSISAVSIPGFSEIYVTKVHGIEIRELESVDDQPRRGMVEICLSIPDIISFRSPTNKYE